VDICEANAQCRFDKMCRTDSDCEDGDPRTVCEKSVCAVDTGIISGAVVSLQTTAVLAIWAVTLLLGTP
jgi:hypothetical protein